MSEFSITISKCRREAEQLRQCASDVKRISGEVEVLSGQLTGEQQSYSQMRTNLRKLSEHIGENQIRLEKLGEILNRCMDCYEKAEIEILEQQYVLEHIREVKNQNDGFDFMKLMGFTADEEGQKKLEKYIVKLLAKMSGSGGGVAKDLYTYAETLTDFLKGDKSLKDLTDLGSDGADLWKGLYEYLNGKVPGDALKAQYGDIAAGVGIAGALLGVIGAGSQAVATEGKSTGQIVSDWIDTGKEGIGIVEGIYEIGHDKMPGGGYFTLGKTVTSFFSEFSESISKYGADGEMSSMDWAETAIDSFIEGLTELISGVTKGWIDIDGEYVSESVKGWAGDWGNRAGEKILNDPKVKQEYMNGNGFDKFRITMWSIFSTAF